MVGWVIAVGAIVVLVPLFSLLTYALPRTIESGVTPDRYDLTHESVTFRTSDGVELDGWFLPAAKSTDRTPTLIFVHGYPAEKGDLLTFARHFVDSYNVLLFDMRALGESGGTFSTLGVRETRDLTAAASYASERTNGPIGVWGFSVGGAVALMTAAEDQRIDAVAAHASYASLGSMAREVFPVPGVDRVFGAVLNWWSWLLFGAHPEEVSPAKTVSRISVPTLITHSRSDHVVPLTEARRLQQASAENPAVEARIYDQGGHGALDRHMRRDVRAFFDNRL